LYVTWQDPAGTLYLEEPGNFSAFFETGALESSDGTSALTLLPDSTLTTTALDALPAPAQIFDVHY
jgi:hypothetical protein